MADLTVDLEARKVARGAAEVPVGKLTFELLKTLIEAAPRALSSEQLRERVWRAEYVSEETLKQRVSLLRRALGQEGSVPLYVETVRGYGYRLGSEPRRLDLTVKRPLGAGWRRTVVFWLLVLVLLMIVGLLASGMRILKTLRAEAGAPTEPLSETRNGLISKTLLNGYAGAGVDRGSGRP